MNALKLHAELLERGVLLEADGRNLKVDAPAGALNEEDLAALLEAKPALLKALTRPAERRPRKSEARWVGPGWIRILDPEADEWHEVPSSTCLPGIIAEADANRNRRKGGAA
jgi:hypothetical protein